MIDMGTIVWYNTANKQKQMVFIDHDSKHYRKEKRMAQPQGIILYNEYIDSFEKLPAADFKCLIVNGMRYNNGQDIGELTPMAELFWPLLCASIDRAHMEYDKRCEINRKRAQKRWEKQSVIMKDAREDVLFSETEKEQMSCDGKELTDKNGTKMPDDAAACRSMPTQTQNETQNETQTQSQSVTETQIETVTQSQSQPQSPTHIFDRKPCAEIEYDGGCDWKDFDYDADCGSDGGTNPMDEKEMRDHFVKPTREEVRRYCVKYTLLVDPERFYNYYEERGWHISGEPVQSWRSLAECWQKRAEEMRAVTERPRETTGGNSEKQSSYDVDQFIEAAMRHSFDELR